MEKEKSARLTDICMIVDSTHHKGTFFFGTNIRNEYVKKDYYGKNAQKRLK